MTARLLIVGHKSNRMLAEGIKRAGGALHAASNDFNQSLAILTAGNASIQDPTSVSQLLKTMSMRLNGASAADLEALGIDTTGMTQGKKSIVQQYKAMAGIDIMEGTNYKSTYQILDELYEKWNSLSMVERQAIAEASGGKRAGSVFASLMTNWEDARKVVEAAERGVAEHSGQKELENASRSVQFSINQLKSAGQELAYDFLDSGALKKAIDLLGSFVNVIDDVVKATDGLLPVLAGAGAAFYAFNTATGLTKNLANLAKVIQKAFAVLTGSKIADTAANLENAASEAVDAAAKDNTARASRNAAAAQIEESAAQRLDSLNNIGGGMDDAVKGLYKQESLLGKGLGALGFDITSSASMAAAASIGALVAVLAAAGATAYMVYQRNEDLKDSALELANSYKAFTEQIDGYKSQITDLNNTINDSNTSYEDAKAAREQLLSIQNALIENYGAEAGNIELVTQAINGQVDALDILAQKKWQQTKAEFNETKGIGLIDGINQMMHGASSNMEVMEDEMFNARVKVRATAIDDKEFLQQMEEALGGEYEVSMNAGILELTGDLDEVKDKLYQIREAAEKTGTSGAFISGLDKQINDVEDTLNKYQDMSDQWILNEKVLPNYSDQFQEMQSAYSKYRQAIIDDNKEDLKSAQDEIVKVMTELPADNSIRKFFRNMYPEIKAEIGSWQIGEDIKYKTLDDLQSGITDAINSFGSLEELKNAERSSNAEAQQSYQTVNALAERYEMTVDQLIAKLKEMGYVSSNFTINQPSISRFGEAMNRRGSTYNESESYKLDTAISQSEYSSQITTYGEAYWDKIAEKIDEAHRANDGLELSQQQVNAAVKQGTEEYIAEAEAAERVAAGLDESLSSSDLATNLVDQYDKAFKAIGSAYQDLVEKKFDLSKVDLSSITAIKDAMKDLQSNLSVDGIDFNTEAYEHLLDVVTNTASSSEQIKAAFDNMGTALISSLDGVTEENYKVAESFLQTHGVVDASLGAFMAYANGIDEAKAKTLGLVDANGQVSGSTASAEEALVAEMYAGQNTSDALEYLRICMQNVSLQGIDISNALAALQDLEAQARATGSSITAITGMQNAATAYSTATSAADRKRLEGRYKLLQAAQTNAYNKQLEEIQNRQKVNPSNYGGAGSGSKGGGGGGGAKDTKEQTDALKELSAQLDEIQSAYSSLSEIVKSYNENGKLTIDQAQELINTDFRYLAMLTDENGQLRLNEQGFRDLAQAKLQEMQIQLAKNAIDTVNGLQSEADAVNFLTYAYEGLKGAALGATEAMLQSAVAAAHARGIKQGEAADKILAGYQATKQAIGNVDLSSGSLAGKKDEKEKTDKDKDKKQKEQQDTKTKWNWLDQLVKKIQRRVDQLAKRAEKYFDYQEKNALVDKQLVENRKMIATQELATGYYQNKATKALKRVPKKYRNLVSGDFDPATVKNLVQELGSSKTEKLQEYLDWQDLLEKSQDALTEAYEQERTLIAGKLDNILEYFDTLISYQENIIKSIDTSLGVDAAKGLMTDINKLLNKYGEESTLIDKSGEREQAYRDQAATINSAIEDSYNRQIKNLESGYKDTTSYQKLKNSGKQGRAKSELNSNYQVLAEDVDAYIKASKNQNKKGRKGEEARAEMDRLHQKYLDSVAELQSEQAAALASNQQALEDQMQQNKIAVEEAREQIWNTIKSVLDSLFETYERRVKQFDVVVNRWGTVADTLSKVSDKSILNYGVADIFGLSGDLSDVLKNQLNAIQDEIDAYHDEYNFYARMIQAATAETNEEKIALFKQILAQKDITAENWQKVQGYINQLVSDQDWDTTSWVTEYKEGQNGIMDAISSLIQTAEDIGDSLVDQINDSTNKLIDSLRALQEAYSAKAGLINDEWVVDSNGLTDYGYAKISALNDAANVARQRAAGYYKAYANLIAVDEETRSKIDDYDKQLNESVKNYYDAVKDIHSVYDEIYEIANKALQKEIDNLNKLVDNYKRALNAKKSYYDYDKRLKDQNKNIQSITAEIKALENVGDAASKARIKALQSELKDAQDELDDTVFNHQIEVETDALDKLIADMTEALQNTAETIQETFEKWSKTISEVVDASNAKDAESIFTELINYLSNGIMSDEARAAEERQKQEQQQEKINQATLTRDEAKAAAEAKKQKDLQTLNYDQNYANAMAMYNELSERYSRKNEKIEIAEIWSVDGFVPDEATYGMTLTQQREYYEEQARQRYKQGRAEADYYKNLANSYTTQYNAIIKSYNDTLSSIKKTFSDEIADIDSSIVSTQITTAPTLSGTSNIANDIANGVLSGLSISGLSSSETSKQVLAVLSGADGIPKISSSISTIKANVIDLTSEVQTIRANTTTMVSQLDAIKTAVASPQINLSIEGEDLYSGMKRVGKVVVYR